MIIGILGGMGPVASAQTYMHIIRTCQKKYGAVQDTDFPEIFIYNLPLQDFNDLGFEDTQRNIILLQLIKGLKKLEDAGATVLLIDCNTVHTFYPEFKKYIQASILNLIQLTTDKVQEKNIKKVSILSSHTSRRIGLYEKTLQTKNIECIHITDTEQQVVDDAIIAVMRGKNTDIHIQNILIICKRLIHHGAESIILGCTEISCLLKNIPDKKIFIDSQGLAIDTAVEMWHANTI